MNHSKEIAGIFAGAGSLLLIFMGHTTEGVIILSTMLGFFVGEVNGQRKATENKGEGKEGLN